MPNPNIVNLEFSWQGILINVTCNITADGKVQYQIHHLARDTRSTRALYYLPIDVPVDFAFLPMDTVTMEVCRVVVACGNESVSLKSLLTVMVIVIDIITTISQRIHDSDFRALIYVVRV